MTHESADRELAPYAAVVLAGGRAARLGGVDKPSIELQGRTLLARVLDAVADAAEVVVVGDPVATQRSVTFTRESPLYGGPAAALLTGRDALVQVNGTLAVLAGDMPWLTAATLHRLREAGPGGDGAVLVGPDGRRQLAMVLDVRRLDELRAHHEHPHGLALHRLVAGLDLVEVEAVGREHRDLDTWADVRDVSS